MPFQNAQRKRCTNLATNLPWHQIILRRPVHQKNSLESKKQLKKTETGNYPPHPWNSLKKSLVWAPETYLWSTKRLCTTWPPWLFCCCFPYQTSHPQTWILPAFFSTKHTLAILSDKPTTPKTKKTHKKKSSQNTHRLLPPTLFLTPCQFKQLFPIH